MPCMGPTNRRPETLDRITNRILEMIHKEFGVSTRPLGEPNDRWSMDEKFKTELRDWVERASLSDCHNGF